jgi:hypothetical protein
MRCGDYGNAKILDVDDFVAVKAFEFNDMIYN